MSDVLYEGHRFADHGAQVWIVDENGDKRELPHAIVKHSPTGFEWGYGGSGPSELALNLLVRALGAAAECPRCGSWGEGTCSACDGTGLAPVVVRGYQAFKREFIEPIHDDGWTYTRTRIIEWAVGFEAQRAGNDLLRLAQAEGGTPYSLPGTTGDPARSRALRGVPS